MSNSDANRTLPSAHAINSMAPGQMRSKQRVDLSHHRGYKLGKTASTYESFGEDTKSFDQNGARLEVSSTSTG